MTIHDYVSLFSKKITSDIKTLETKRIDVVTNYLNNKNLINRFDGFYYICVTKNQENMDLQTIAFDLYQSNIIGGIKLKALISALSEDQKKIYAETIEEEIIKNQSQLEASLKKEQVDEVLKELRNF